jgi:hypothetical protein
MTVAHLGSDSEYVKITFNPPFSSEGWCQAEVEISVHGFLGRISPWFDADEVARFTSEVASMYKTLNGTAEFKPLEEQLILKLHATSNGHILAKGEAWSEAKCGNKLEFELGLDQSYLPSFIAGLQDALHTT